MYEPLYSGAVNNLMDADMPPQSIKRRRLDSILANAKTHYPADRYLRNSKGSILTIAIAPVNLICIIET
jgi:hypothetical protein